MKLDQISQFKIGKPIQGFYLCKKKELKNTRNGDLYLDILLSDKTGFVSGKVWNYIDTFKTRFKKGDAVAVKGIPEEYKNEIQLIITNINIATITRYKRYGFNPKQLVPTTKISSKKLWKELLEIIEKVSNSHLKVLLNNIFKDNKSTISILPATLDNHHPVRGGYLEHIVSIGKLANKIKSHYKEIDVDLLIAGILLRDIGIIKGLSSDLESNYTISGKLIGNTILGWDIIKTAISKIDCFPENTANKLEYIILSQDRVLSNKKGEIPIIPEALLVHLLNEIDCKLNLVMRNINDNLNLNDWIGNKDTFGK